MNTEINIKPGFPDSDERTSEIPEAIEACRKSASFIEGELDRLFNKIHSVIRYSDECVPEHHPTKSGVTDLSSALYFHNYHLQELGSKISYAIDLIEL